VKKLATKELRTSSSKDGRFAFISSLFSLLERKRELEHERRTSAASFLRRRRRFAPPLPPAVSFSGEPEQEEQEEGKKPAPRTLSRTGVVSADAVQTSPLASAPPPAPPSPPAPPRCPPLTLAEVFSHPVEALEELLEPGTEQRGEVVFEKEATEAVATTTSSSSPTPSSPAPQLLLSLSSSLVLLGLCTFWLYLHV